MSKQMVTLSDYAEKYETIKFERDDGILLMTLHCNDSDYVTSAIAHTEMADAFAQVGADHDNHIVILTGTGDSFGNRLAAASFYEGDESEGQMIARIHFEGRRIMQNVLDVEAPMIAAINGPMTSVAPFALTCDITLCAEHATFSDVVHFHDNGVVPGDGVHTVWPLLLGANRARYFLLTGQALSAQEALAAGVVNEILPRDRLLDRAWELARQLKQKPPHVLRYARLVLNQRFRRAVLEDTGFGYGMQWLGLRTKG
jgi:enoyl-CoA hydratase/carnithine racemase